MPAKGQRTAPRVELVCDHCARTFERLASDIARFKGKRTFCGSECFKAFGVRTEHVEIRCAHCGVKTTRRASDVARLISGRAFCGSECARAAGTKPRKGESKPCEGCGTAVYSTPSSVGRFCSKSCMDNHQRRNRVELVCPVCEASFFLSQSVARQRTNPTCSRHCDTLRKATSAVGRFHNGKPACRDSSGYIQVWEPDHPKAYKGGWILEHRWVVEQQLGRHLESDEHVHHINGQKWDNRPENLQVIGHSDHSVLTAAERKREQARMEAELSEYRRRFGPLT